MTPARSPYGDLADDVALLATAGKVITRHDGMYRLDGAAEKLTAAMVRGMAAMVRNQRWEAAHAPRFKDGHEIKKTAVLDTRPGGGGASGTNEGHDAAPATPICVKCEGPISKWSKGQCAVCYAQAGRGSYPQRPYAERPDKFWHAVQQDAAPSGCADVIQAGVPPVSTPQTASGPGRSAVTPAPESGASAGTYCPCGRPIPHGGRCWHKRGLPGPVEPKKKQPTERVARYVSIGTLSAEVDALKRKVAALEALMSMEGLR